MEDAAALALTDIGEGDAPGGAGRHEEDEGATVEGIFSWTWAWCMMFWVLCFISSLVMGGLTYQGHGFLRISEEVSFVRERTPPYGPADQPKNLRFRDINEPFRYNLPQLALYYSLLSASLGMFTCSFFANWMLLEDQGSKTVADISGLIVRGVSVYMSRTVPVILLFTFVCGSYVYITAGWGTLACFAAGAVLNLISAYIGMRMSVAGTGRLANAMGSRLYDCLQIGIRTGSIGGLLATSLALGGMSVMWLLILNTSHLTGFGSGASIVSFYLRVGGGIFSKGANIGSDLVGKIEGDLDSHKADEERKIFELQQRIAELEEKRKEKINLGFADTEDDDKDMMDKLRMMEEEMQDIVSFLHPIEYLNSVGENICDVAGTCADLFESMVLILSTSAIIGAKISAVPSFFSGLPFWIVASGNIGCALVAFKCHCGERFTSWQLRWSLRVNLVVVVIFVQLVQMGISYLEWLRGGIEFTEFWHFVVISSMGQLVPEACVLFGEFFTSVDYGPVKSLAQNSYMSVVQVVLQGLGQGFFSTFFPAVAMVAVVMLTWSLEGHYGIALLSAASVSGTGFQGGIASYGAIATNAHRVVHLTTYHSMTRHRANTCAALGDTTAHSGNTISAINAFSAVFNIAVTLLAQTYTRLGVNYQAVSGAPLSDLSQAGLTTGVVFTMLFTANTTVSCLDTSKAFLRFCKESSEVGRNDAQQFPHSHLKPLTKLTIYGTITSMRMVFSPLINTLVVPMMGGFLFGTRGLLFLISGSNVLVLCLSVFLVNSGQAWVAARKFILFGYLKDPDGSVIGPDSMHYANLGVGAMIGGPFEDTTGPALNNFIKFVAVFAFVTESLYDPTPEKTWPYGFLAAAVSLALVIVFRFGLTLILSCVTNFIKQRQLQKEEDDLDDELDEEEEDFSAKAITG